MSEYDEKDWGLEIERFDDGDVLLRQGGCCKCGSDEDVIVRLHPSFHFPLLAEYLGLMTRAQYDNAMARSNDRLQLLAVLIEAHLPPDHPLVKASRNVTRGHANEPPAFASTPAKTERPAFDLTPPV